MLRSVRRSGVHAARSRQARTNEHDAVQGGVLDLDGAPRVQHALGPFDVSGHACAIEVLGQHDRSAASACTYVPPRPYLIRAAAAASA